MECIAGNEKLHPLAGTDVRTDDNMLGRPIAAQQKYFEWIAEIILIELSISDAAEPCGGSPRQSLALDGDRSDFRGFMHRHAA